MARAWLAFVRKYGWGIPQERLRKMFGGPTKSALANWRKTEEYRAAEEAVRAEFAARPAPELEWLPEFDRWLDAFEGSRDRSRACEESGVGRGLIELALESCEPFQVAFQYLETGHLLAVEDTAQREAIDAGGPAARFILQSRHPDYTPRSKVEHTGQVEHKVTQELTEGARAKIEALVAARKQLEGDVVDAEVVDG